MGSQYTAAPYSIVTTPLECGGDNVLFTASDEFELVIQQAPSKAAVCTVMAFMRGAPVPPPGMAQDLIYGTEAWRFRKRGQK